MAQVASLQYTKLASKLLRKSAIESFEAFVDQIPDKKLEGPSLPMKPQTIIAGDDNHRLIMSNVRYSPFLPSPFPQVCLGLPNRLAHPDPFPFPINLNHSSVVCSRLQLSCHTRRDKGSPQRTPTGSSHARQQHRTSSKQFQRVCD